MSIAILLEINEEIRKRFEIEGGDEFLQWIHEQLTKAIPKVEALKEKAWMYDDLCR